MNGKKAPGSGASNRQHAGIFEVTKSHARPRPASSVSSPKVVVDVKPVEKSPLKKEN